MADLTSEQPVDLTNCDREPIHIPGSVQPHATLLVLDGPQLVIRQASSNCGATLGLAHEELLGESLAHFLDAEAWTDLQAQIISRPLEAAPHYLKPLRLGKGRERFEAMVHRYEGALILELESWPDLPPLAYQDVFSTLQVMLAQLQGEQSVVAFCQHAASQIREFIGFDRVMIYRFAEDLSGHIIAEAKREDLDSFLGWHYPASDIPKQARELFRRSRLRLIPDLGYTSAAILPGLRPDNGQPLDMSFCVTRSVSPIHVEYLLNMGVHASMSLSLVVDNRLWGLVACHHYAPRYVPHTLRMACDFLAQTLSFLVAGRQASEDHHYLRRLHEGHRQLEEALLQENDFGAALARLRDDTLIGLKADGAAFVSAEEVSLFGLAPEKAAVLAMSQWLCAHEPEQLWQTDRLGESRPELAARMPEVSGVLALCLSRETPVYLFWFRREVLQTVKWAGDPSKPVTAGPHGDRLTPRKSFALWKEEVHGHAEPWLPAEKSAALQLRNTYLELFARRALELSRLNGELAERNRQLDAFAYIASHDLKEPLRGIHNFSQFVLEDCSAELQPEGVANLQTIVRLSRRMEGLLDALLKYSRLSRTEMPLKPVDLNDVLADALDTLGHLIAEHKVEIRVPRTLPKVMGHPELLSEVLTNLISNAIKYNDKPQRWVEVSCCEGAGPGDLWFYVQDNGIGIAPEHQADVFRIFKRLHARDQFGGGTGAGLTIVRKIVERHGGKIRLESATNVGSRFLFTLPAIN